MPEQREIYTEGDSVLTMTEEGRVTVYEVDENGELTRDGRVFTGGSDGRSRPEPAVSNRPAFGTGTSYSGTDDRAWESFVDQTRRYLQGSLSERDAESYRRTVLGVGSIRTPEAAWQGLQRAFGR